MTTLPSKPRSTIELPVAGLAALTLGVTLATGCARPDAAELAFQRGLNAIDDQRHDLARAYLAEAARLRPDHPETLRNLGLSWQRGANQALVPALEVSERYLALVPDDQEILRLMVEAHLMLGRSGDAAAHLEALDDSAPSWSLRARALLDGDVGGAERAIERALSLDEHDAAARLVAADVAAKAGRGDEALHLAAAVALDPLDDRARYRLGRARMLAGERESGRRELEIAGELARLREVGATNGGNAAAGLRILDAMAGDLDPANRKVMGARTRLLLESGRVEEGVALLAELEESHPLSASERLTLASLLARAGRRADALARYRALLEADPSLKPARLASVRLHRALGERDAAEELLAEGLALEPHAASLHAEVADLALEDGRTEEAREALSAALELAPWAVGRRIELARIEIAEGRLDAADGILAAAPEPSERLRRFRARHGLAPLPEDGRP